ncbi:hypothetical protein BDW62DRAFT_152379 [Aspergillus aurantiobrunneus]
MSKFLLKIKDVMTGSKSKSKRSSTCILSISTLVIETYLCQVVVRIPGTTEMNMAPILAASAADRIASHFVLTTMEQDLGAMEPSFDLALTVWATIPFAAMGSIITQLMVITIRRTLEHTALPTGFCQDGPLAAAMLLVAAAITTGQEIRLLDPMVMVLGTI